MTYIEPFLLLGVAITLVGLLKPPSGRRWVASIGLSAIFLSSWPPVDWLLSRPLVARYPARPFQPPAGIQAIVVLGSAVRPPRYDRPYSMPDSSTFSRCEHAAWIYRKYGPLPVLACEGGRNPPTGLMADLLRRAGVPEDRIWIEDRSLSTHENARYGAAILRQHRIQRIVLVVDAQSMLRASACFRNEGLDVTPAPTEFRAIGHWTEELLPNWRAIRRNEVTLHETIGIAWYSLRGWI